MKAMGKFSEYMTLIRACYSEGDFDSCLGLCIEMVEKGLEIPAHAYGLVIGGLCKEGKSAEGYAVFESMIQRGCKSNVAIYTSHVDSFATNGNVEETIRLFERMKNGGLELDKVSYGAIFDGLCKISWMALEKLGEWMKLRNFLKKCLRKVVHGIHIATMPLINAFAKCGKMDEALGLFKRMEDEGRIKQACKLADGIVDRGREIPCRVHTNLLNALRKAGNADLAMKLMHSKDCFFLLLQIVFAVTKILFQIYDEALRLGYMSIQFSREDAPKYGVLKHLLSKVNFGKALIIPLADLMILGCDFGFCADFLFVLPFA
ncbi:Pentatricopeptide repeat [Dillenia turbinata]|uniref:Pentatricopeptide repeat n=1 Tax=Dillenia turbinata TaxID=194707 RepID=A0AAN8YY74_9MAGN